MRAIVILLIGAVVVLVGNIAQQQPYELVQNKPVQVGVPVTFTIVSSHANGEAPEIAWDFGDGLGEYQRGLTSTHIFKEPGVYYIFARIKGEDIPLSIVQMVTKPIQSPASTHSSTIALDTVLQKLWAVNPDNNSVALIDPISAELIAEIPAGKHPRTVAIDKQGNAWVANEDDATIAILAVSGLLKSTLKMPYASRPYGICFDPQKKYAYVTLQGTGRLLKIDASTHEILQTVDVGRSPRGIAITSNGKKILVTQFVSPQDKGLMREIDAESMTISKTIALAYDETADFEDRGRGVPNYLSSVTISPDGTEAWVPSKKDNTARGLFRDGDTLTFDNTVRTIVSKIDMYTGEEILNARIDINDADMACAVEFSPYGNMAFVALQGNNRIVMVDVEHHSRLGSIDTTGLAPQGMVLNKEGTRLFVHNFLTRTVRVYDVEDIILGNHQVARLLATLPTVLQEILPPQVLKGKQIFYNAQDERMTFAGYISCASCHLDGGSDERVWDFTERGEGLRNTHTLQGRGGLQMGNVHWTSNFDEIQDFENDIRNNFKGKGFMPDELFNSGTVSDPLGDKKAGLSPELDALAAYVASLDQVHPSPYRNADGSLTPDALVGKKIFIEAGCGSCHGGPDFTDRAEGKFHDVGTIQASSGKRRNGTLMGFGTPTLKGVWESAPYLHDGSAKTLHEVLTTKNIDKKHGDLSMYSTAEIDQLVAYLNQIDENESLGEPTGLWEQILMPAPTLSLYPNPANTLVNISLHDIVRPSGTVTIINASSRQVVSQLQLKGEHKLELDVSHLKPGVYTVQYSDGVHKRSSKMVIQ